jgi:hypothetical protein
MKHLSTVIGLVVGFVVVTALPACGKSEAQPVRSTMVTRLLDAGINNLNQCPKGGCGVDELWILDQACGNFRAARMVAMNQGDKEMIQVTRNYVKKICGND